MEIAQNTSDPCYKANQLKHEMNLNIWGTDKDMLNVDA